MLTIITYIILISFEVAHIVPLSKMEIVIVHLSEQNKANLFMYIYMSICIYSMLFHLFEIKHSRFRLHGPQVQHLISIHGKQCKNMYQGVEIKWSHVLVFPSMQRIASP